MTFISHDYLLTYKDGPSFSYYKVQHRDSTYVLKTSYNRLMTRESETLTGEEIFYKLEDFQDLWLSKE